MKVTNFSPHDKNHILNILVSNEICMDNLIFRTLNPILIN